MVKENNQEVHEESQIEIFRIQMNRNSAILIAVIMLVFYCITVPFVYPLISSSALMLMVIPALLSAGLLGLRFGYSFLTFAALYSLIYLYIIDVPKDKITLSFLPGVVMSYFITFFIAKLHDLSVRIKKELKEKLEIEKIALRKNSELQVYMERLEDEITEKYHAEKILRKSEEQFRNLVEKSRIGIIIDDINGNLTYFNNEFMNITGYSEDELKSIHLYDMIFPDDLPLVLEYHNKRIQKIEVPSKYEVRMIKKSGELIYLEIDVVLLKEKDLITGTRSYIWDISSKKEALKALKESEERFRSIFEHSPFGIYRIKSSGELVYASNSFVNILRLKSIDDIIGKNISELFENSTHRKEIIDVLIKEKTLNSIENEWTCLDGMVFWGRESAWVVFDESNNIEYFDGIIEDITSKIQVEEERKSLTEQLLSARSELKILSGLLPICSSCKRIRDEEGSWLGIESYIDEHSEAEFSHGICPDCARKLYPSLY